MERGSGGGCYTGRDDNGQLTARRQLFDKAREPPYLMKNVQDTAKDLAGSLIIKPPSRKAWGQCVTEMLLLCNEAARRGSKRGAVAHKKDANGVQCKPLGLEYIVDRIDVDDPLTGYMVRSSEEGWLQGFITVTTFMTWHRNFEWDSLSKHNGISSCDRETRAVDADGALAKALMALPRQQAHPTRQDSFLSPRVAEISLLGGLGCGAKLMQLVLDDMAQKDEYDFVVLQATDVAIAFYERLGFVRVGAIAKRHHSARAMSRKRPAAGGVGAAARCDDKRAKKSGGNARLASDRDRKPAPNHVKLTGGVAAKQQQRPAARHEGWRQCCEAVLRHVRAMPGASLLMHARATPLMLEGQKCVDLAGVMDALRVLPEEEEALYRKVDRGGWGKTVSRVELDSDPTAWLRQMRLPRYADATQFCLDMRLVLEAMVRDPLVPLRVKQASAAAFTCFRHRWNALGACTQVQMELASVPEAELPSPYLPSLQDTTSMQTYGGPTRFFVYVDWQWNFFRGFKLYEVYDQVGEPGKGCSTMVYLREWCIAPDAASADGYDANNILFTPREEKASKVDWKPRVDDLGLLSDSHVEVAVRSDKRQLESSSTDCVRIPDQDYVVSAAYTKLVALRTLSNVSPATGARLIPLAPQSRPVMELAHKKSEAKQGASSTNAWQAASSTNTPNYPVFVNKNLPRIRLPCGRQMYRCSVCGLPKVGHVCAGYRVVDEATCRLFDEPTSTSPSQLARLLDEPTSTPPPTLTFQSSAPNQCMNWETATATPPPPPPLAEAPVTCGSQEADDSLELAVLSALSSARRREDLCCSALQDLCCNTLPQPPQTATEIKACERVESGKGESDTQKEGVEQQNVAGAEEERKTEEASDLQEGKVEEKKHDDQESHDHQEKGELREEKEEDEFKEKEALEKEVLEEEALQNMMPRAVEKGDIEHARVDQEAVVNEQVKVAEEQNKGGEQQSIEEVVVEEGRLVNGDVKGKEEEAVEEEEKEKQAARESEKDVPPASLSLLEKDVPPHQETPLDQEQGNEEDEMEEEALSEYEVKRLQRMQENKRLMLATGILQVTSDKGAAVKSRDIEAEKKRKIELKKLREKLQINPEQIRKLRTRVPKPLDADELEENAHQTPHKASAQVHSYATATVHDKFTRGLNGDEGRADERDRQNSFNKVQSVHEREREERLKQVVAMCQSERETVMELYRIGPEMTRPYNWFVKQISPHMRIRYPSWHQHDVTRIISAVWKSLPPAEKAKWDLENPDNEPSSIPSLAEAIVADAVSESSGLTSALTMPSLSSPNTMAAKCAMGSEAHENLALCQSGSESVETRARRMHLPSHLANHVTCVSHIEEVAANGRQSGRSGSGPNTPSAPSTYTTETDGEYVASIASRWRVDLDLLVAMNEEGLAGLSHKSRLKLGTRLHLPRPGQEHLNESACKEEAWAAYCHWTYPDQSVTELFPSYMMVKRVVRDSSVEAGDRQEVERMRSRIVAAPPPVLSCEEVRTRHTLRVLNEEHRAAAKTAAAKLRYTYAASEGWHVCADGDRVCDIAASLAVSASLILVINAPRLPGLTHTSSLKAQTKVRLPGPALHDQDVEWFEICIEILRKLVELKDARPFLEALDWMALGLLDYPFIVNMPMDLTTVETRLCDGFYRNAHAFARDVRLTFNNALTFYAPEDETHALAAAMQSAFEETWAGHGFQMPIVAHAPQQNGKSSSKSRSGCSTTPATPKKPEMYNQVVKVEGEEASHAPYYFVLHYVPDLHWCHLAAMREDGIFPELTRKGLPHPHAGKKRWRLTPEGESKELDVSADRCTRVPSKTINCVPDADKELWCIDDCHVPLSKKERVRELARQRKRRQRDRMSGKGEMDKKWKKESIGDSVDWTGECGVVLAKLMRHERAWPFCEPVDPVALSLPDYLSVIESPMDLRTVSERLNQSKYTNARDFVRDVKLTFENALKYNPEDNFVYKYAATMKTCFESIQSNSPVLRVACDGTSRRSVHLNGTRNTKRDSVKSQSDRPNTNDRTRSVLESSSSGWRSRRPSNTPTLEKSYGTNRAVRDSFGRFVKTKSDLQRVGEDGAGCREAHEQQRNARGAHVGSHMRVAKRVPKRRLEIDDRGRSLMPVRKRHLLDVKDGRKEGQLLMGAEKMNGRGESSAPSCSTGDSKLACSSGESNVLCSRGDYVAALYKKPADKDKGSKSSGLYNGTVLTDAAADLLLIRFDDGIEREIPVTSVQSILRSHTHMSDAASSRRGECR